MAWGRSSVPKQAPPPPSAFFKLLPLIIFLIIVAGGAFVGYHIIVSVQNISDAATKKLESKNVVFTKDGMKVGVKEVKNESYVDKTQSIFVKAWNLSTWPGYKSRIWNQPAKDEGLKERKPLERKTSTR